MKTEILIVGSGCSGLYCALKLPRNSDITIITKSKVEESDSFLAQGGMCMLRDESDYDSFFEDTLKAGHYENDKKSVELMLKNSKAVVDDLILWGAEFKKNEDNTLTFTKEGAHSNKRIIFHADETGKEITSTLLKETQKRDNIKILEDTMLLDIIEKDEKCIGAIVKTSDGKITKLAADFVVFATGGIGGLFKHTTNYRHLTGDALAIAENHNVKLRDITYVQIHPTTFYASDDRRFLISESVRGEGALLRDKNGNRFTDELLPRDLLTKTIKEQMQKDKTEFVWEDLTVIPKEHIYEHFPNIAAHCLEKGYDVTKQWIPVVPSQHYFMGGIWVDYVSKTSMDRLYAVGETACNGVHGKNRLASNSLLESLVFAGLAAKDITESKSKFEDENAFIEKLDTKRYENTEKLEKEYQALAKKLVEKDT